MKPIISLLILISITSSAKVITKKEILTEALTSLPSLLKEIEANKIYESKINEADGAFDSTINANTSEFLDGFYDSDFSSVSVQKPLKFLNSKVSIGARKSNGNLPVYYQEYETGEKPEYFLKLNMSLLKFRRLDPKRFKILEAKNKFFLNNQKLKSKIIDIKLKVNKLYLDWLYVHKKRSVYKELIQLNEKRISALKRRVNKNDLAKIYLTESEQYLLDFKNILIETDIKLSQINNKLKVLYPKILPQDTPEMEIELSTINNKRYNTEKILTIRPEIKAIKKLIELTKDEQILAKQYLNPTLDVSATRYSSSSKKEKFQDETFASLKLVIPLGRSLGKGKLSVAKAKERKGQAMLLELKRLITLEIENLKAQMTGDLLLLSNLKRELKITKILQKAEWRKFNSGASDFFLINTRDTNFAKVSLSYIEKLISYKQAKYNLDLWDKQLVLSN